ncbi:MAG TPA: chemotaxis protein CheB [Candidatus Dormibacteraeota bacterium]|nr:chemotaxis protein CheB [Candidatus Dormibacteraeota bacterium]
MTARRIVVIGGSAGSIEGLKLVSEGLPPDLQAAVFAAVHVSSTGRSGLAELLQRHARVRVSRAVDGAPIEEGEMYVGPADRHLLVGRTRMHLGHGPKENGHRPAIDALFRSAARNHGSRVIGVVLSGLLDDGALGLAMIGGRGGVTVVEDPDTAAFPSMPQNAVQVAQPDHIVPAQQIPALLAELCVLPVPAGEEPAGGIEPGDVDDEGVDEGIAAADVPGAPTGLTCPECHGALWEDPLGGLNFRCRIGHRYAAESLVERQADSVENALWAALRALEEQGSTATRLGDRLGRLGDQVSQRRFRERAESARRQAHVLRRLLTEPPD